MKRPGDTIRLTGRVEDSDGQGTVRMADAPSSDPSALEDARWVEAILARRSSEEEEEGYAALMRKYWKLVNVLALSRLGDPREAEDVAQETFFRAFRALESLAQPVAFLGWLLRILRNLVTDHLRARRPLVSLDSIAAKAGAGRVDPVDHRPGFVERIETAEEVDLVLDAMKELPERYREMLALRYIHGLDGKTIAGVLGEPEGTVRNRLFRALEKLRETIKRGKARAR